MTVQIVAVVVFLFVSLLGPAANALESRTENFDTDPQWSILNNNRFGNVFGYQTSSFAGGNPGEAGGTFTRSDFVRYYGDTDLGGTITLDNAFSASGKFDHTAANFPDFGNTFIIGHFSSTSKNPKVGIGLFDIGAGLRWGPRIAFDDFVTTGGLPQTLINLTPNVDHTWEYSWNPHTDTLTTTLDGFTQHLVIPPELVSRGAKLDSFGLAGSPTNFESSSKFATVFIDDVTYSTAVPEPSTAFLCLLFPCAFGIVARSRRAGQGRG